MEYLPRNWRTRMEREREREQGAIAISFLISLFPRSSTLPPTRLDYTRFLSRVFPQKNRFACPPFHHVARARRNTERTAHTHRHGIVITVFFLEQFHLLCIRILLLPRSCFFFFFFSSSSPFPVSSTCILCPFHFFLRFLYDSIMLRFHPILRHEKPNPLAFLPMAFPRKTRRYTEVFDA